MGKIGSDDKKLTELKELLEIIKHKMDMIEATSTGQSAAVSLMKDQLSVVNSKLNDVIARLDDPDSGLQRLNERMDAHTAAVMKLEQTVGAYGDMYKQSTN